MGRIGRPTRVRYIQIRGDHRITAANILRLGHRSRNGVSKLTPDAQNASSRVGFSPGVGYPGYIRLASKGAWPPPNCFGARKLLAMEDGVVNVWPELPEYKGHSIERDI